jgi:hypothetical protein
MPSTLAAPVAINLVDVFMTTPLHPSAPVSVRCNHCLNAL